MFISDFCDSLLKYPIICTIGETCLLYCLCVLVKLQPFEYYPFQIFRIYYLYVTRILHPGSYETIYDNRIMLCLIDLMWDGIVNSEYFASVFVKQGYVYSLLDILQVRFLIKHLSKHYRLYTPKKRNTNYGSDQPEFMRKLITCVK